jgi:hypothetical protein
MSNNIQFKFTEILTLVNSAKKQEIINDEEKKTIKAFIIQKEPNLTLELEEYEKDQDLRKLIETLKLLCGITEMSSPVDNNLIDRKRKKQKTKKMTKRENKKIEADEEEIDLKKCDYGASPEIVFNKKTIPRESDDED